MGQSSHPRDAFARVFGTGRGPTRREVKRQRELSAQQAERAEHAERVDRIFEMKIIAEILEDPDLPHSSPILRAAVLALAESNPEMASERKLAFSVSNFLTNSEHRQRVMAACTEQAALNVFGYGDRNSWYDGLRDRDRSELTAPILIRMHSVAQ